MQRYTNISTEEIKNTGYYIDVVYDSNEDEYETWLYHEDCTVKEFVFGLQNIYPISKTVEVAVSAVLNGGHINWYRKRYMEGK